MLFENDDGVQPANAFEQLEDLVGPAKEGDVEAMGRIRQVLEDNPGIRRQLGDLGARVERAWIGLLADQNPHVRESLERSLAEMRADLAGDAASAIERLLVDQVVATWLQVRYFEMVAAAYEATGASPKRLRASTHTRLEQAQRRHLAGIKTLTETRRLLGNKQEPQAEEPVSVTGAVTTPYKLRVTP